jgi:hypothetical protein
MLRSLLLIAFLLSVASIASAKTEKNIPVLDEALFNVSFDPKNPITFVGKKSLNGNGQGAGGMMYPADTAGVFLVSILAHAAVSGSVEKSRLNKEQEEANKVLEPFSQHIAVVDTDYLSNELRLKISSSPLEKFTFLHGDNQSENSKWQIKVTPVFLMTQSKSSFLLYNKMTFVDRELLYSKKKKAQKKLKKGALNPYEKLVVIVSDPVLEEDATNYWFRESAKSLYLESFQLGVGRQFGSLESAQTKQVTIKYLEDGVKKIERGYVISQTCKRTLFESLAGEIKSVPNLEFATCTTG